jgi:hypothetical protein
MEHQVFPLDAFPKDRFLKPDFFMWLENAPGIGFHDSVNMDVAITAMGIGGIVTAPKQSDQMVPELMSELHVKGRSRIGEVWNSTFSGRNDHFNFDNCFCSSFNSSM